MFAQKRPYIQYFTLFILVCFTLIRVIQYYAAVSPVGRRNVGHISQARLNNSAINGLNIFRQLDKPLIEQKLALSVPEAKLLTLISGLFLAGLMVLGANPIRRFYRCCPLPVNRLCATLCVFRL